MNAPFHLPPSRRDEIIRAFRDALRRAREEELARMQDVIDVLENLRNGLAELRRDLPSIWR
jgi:hypothetical protein